MSSIADASPLVFGVAGGVVLVLGLVSLGLRLWVPRGPQASAPPPGPFRALRVFFDHPTFVLCSAGAEVVLGIVLVVVAIVRAAR